MAKFDPTPQQARAINSRAKLVVVSAGAGSGKTAVLSQR
ncbi:MAG: UvrD-helicase domain-containing protein, partial [Clostridia bacterium]|nr:UvrD-helicase domain-containing protein [Clostridia bacterium]